MFIRWWPSGVSVKPILFLIYINDIADHTYGICRLFADDTSLGHTRNDLQNLQDMVNSDLYIKKWSEDWLITFNPDKTDIMLFDNRRQGNLSFKFGQTDILSVDFHKYLVIVFILTVNGHDILTTYYLRHPSNYISRNLMYFSS